MAMRTDRRPSARELVRRVIGLVVTTGVLAGCGPANRVADPAASTPATTTPTVNAAPVVTDIPAAAFLQTEDLGKGGYFVDQGQGTDALSPCWGAPLRSDSTRVVREEVVGTYRFVARYDKVNKRPVPDGTVNEVITSYRTGGASVYLDEVREQVARCATEKVDEPFLGTTVVVTWERTVIAEGFAADESLIWRRRSWGIYSGRRHENNDLIAVARLGDVVVMVHIGISPGLPLRDPIDRLAAAAVRRATAQLTP
jgi:hypothetical protein